MSDKKAKIYAPEFKESSAKLALESKSTIAQTARELGVNVNTLHTWISKYSRAKTYPFSPPIINLSCKSNDK